VAEQWYVEASLKALADKSFLRIVTFLPGLSWGRSWPDTSFLGSRPCIVMIGAAAMPAMADLGTLGFKVAMGESVLAESWAFVETKDGLRALLGGAFCGPTIQRLYRGGRCRSRSM